MSADLGYTLHMNRGLDFYKHESSDLGLLYDDKLDAEERAALFEVVDNLNFIISGFNENMKIVCMPDTLANRLTRDNAMIVTCGSDDYIDAFRGGCSGIL